MNSKTIYTQLFKCGEFAIIKNSNSHEFDGIKNEAGNLHIQKLGNGKK